MKTSNTFLRYAGVGIMSNGLLYLVFVAFIWLGLSPLITSALCYAFGLTASYLINRHWSFKSKARHHQDLPRFLFSYGVGFVATMGFIVVLIRWMRPEMAQIINIGLTATVIYFCLRLTGFGGHGGKHAD